MTLGTGHYSGCTAPSDAAGEPASAGVLYRGGLRRDDALVKVKPLLARVEDWRGFLRAPDEEAEVERLRRHERTGRPLGSDRFVKRLERLAGRLLRPQKPGPKRKGEMP